MPRGMKKRLGNNPKRRIVEVDRIELDFLNWLIDNAKYTGSAHHKRSPADYGFIPATAPRPDKSLCDGKVVVLLNEAIGLFRSGIARCMISEPEEKNGCENDYCFPKYVWAVSEDGRVFEAILSKGTNEYHGYELTENDDAMRRQVIYRWRNANCLIN